MKKCPECSSTRLVKGSCHLRDNIGTNAKVFRASSCIRSFNISQPDVILKDNGSFHACLECGAVWSKLDQQVLSNVLKKYADKKELERLELTA